MHQAGLLSSLMSGSRGWNRLVGCSYEGRIGRGFGEQAIWNDCLGHGSAMQKRVDRNGSSFSGAGIEAGPTTDCTRLALCPARSAKRMQRIIGLQSTNLAGWKAL